MTSNNIIKKSLQKNIDYFLKIIDKVSKSKKILINKAKQKFIKDNTSQKTTIINNIDNFDKIIYLMLIKKINC